MGVINWSALIVVATNANWLAARKIPLGWFAKNAERT
jgi:hypothetical protein